MTDYGIQLANLLRRLDEAERELVALRKGVQGELPAGMDGISIEDRLASLEVQSVRALTAQNEPLIVRAGGDAVVDDNPLVMDIEWGIPSTDPGNTATATITLKPCDKDGVLYANAAAVAVYIRDDRAVVQLGPRKWKATVTGPPLVTGTILSFLRFPWDVGSGPAVAGVLIGEGEPDKVRVSVADTKPGYMRFTAGDQQAHHKLIGDSEADACSTTSGAWIRATIIIGANNDEQLKIEHVGPSASCYLYCGTDFICCNIQGLDLDAKGHVRQFFTTDCAAWKGPCA